MQQGSIPWQRGRIERHGGIIKEMLNRIDHEKPIDTLQQLDDALQQCFNAKNTMSVVNGFSPEQAVLGRASKLPASLPKTKRGTRMGGISQGAILLHRMNM